MGERIAQKTTTIMGMFGMNNDNYRSFGSVEGELKVYTKRKAIELVIIDALTQEKVEFLLKKTNEFSLRVAATGWITTNEAGEKLGIEVEKIEFFPAEEELPTVEEITGILGGADNE